MARKKSIKSKSVRVKPQKIENVIKELHVEEKPVIKKEVKIKCPRCGSEMISKGNRNQDWSCPVCYSNISYMN